MALIEGEVMEKNKSGRRRKAWVDNIKEWCGGMAVLAIVQGTIKLVLWR